MNSTGKKAIIFDMDGVLVDSEHAMRSAAIEALARHGVNASHEDFFPFTGMGEDKFIGGVAEKYGYRYTTALKDEAYDIYCANAKEKVEICPDVLETLQMLKSNGYKMAVASAADRIKVEANLSCIGVDFDFFDAVVWGNEVANKKPAPDAFLLAAKKMNAAPESCIVFEDALGGIQAALAANMSAIGVTTTFSSEKLLSEGASYAVKGINELLGNMAILL